MPITGPVSDIDRSINHDPDQTWPQQVKLQVMWMVNGQPRVRTSIIDADQFFGHGRFGAPMEGTALVQMIEHMRRAGPPEIQRKARANYVTKETARAAKKQRQQRR